MNAINRSDRESVNKVKVFQAIFVLPNAMEIAGVIHKCRIAFLVIVVCGDVHIN